MTTSLNGVEVSVHRTALLRHGSFAIVVAAVIALGPSSLLAGGLSALLISACLLSSIAVHEAAHATVARSHGLCVHVVTLHGLLRAGVRRSATTDPRVELRVSLAGPVATTALLCVGGLGWAVELQGPAASTARALVAINAILLMFSL